MNRSNWKGPYVDPKYLKNINQLKKKHLSLKMSRNSDIIPKFVGLTFKIHNGITYKKLIVTKEMIGHKFGEFSFTRGKFSFKKKKSKK